MSTINDNIRELRIARRYTLQYVADYLHTTKQTVQRYETGKITSIPYEKIELLSQLFNVAPSDLMGWQEAPSSAARKDLTDLEEKHLEVFRALDPVDQGQVHGFAAGLLSQEKYNKKGADFSA